MTLSDGILTALGFLFVFAILGAAEALKRFGGVEPEGTRKFVHVGVGHWILVTVGIHSVWWAAVAPLAFVFLNYLSYRRGVFSAMERERGSGGLGTVYYSVALVMLVLVFFRRDMPRWPAVAGILCMAWGDGLAAIVGERWGRRAYALTGGRKSVEGSVAMFLACCIVLVVCRAAADANVGLASVLLVAAIATALEAASPAGTDNLSVPLSTAFLLHWLAR